MKGKLIITASIIIFIFSVQTFPQTFGIKGGISASNVMRKVGDVYLPSKYGYRPTIHLGVFRSKLINESRAFEVGIYLDSKGYIWNQDSEARYKVKPVYIDMPAYFHFRRTTRRDKTFSFIAGSYIGFGVGGVIEDIYAEGGPLETKKIEWGPDGRLKRFDFGYSLGIELSKGRKSFSLIRDAGLWRTNPSKDDYPLVKNSFWRFSYGFSFK